MDRSAAIKLDDPAWAYMKSVGIKITDSAPIGPPRKVDSWCNDKADCVNTVNQKRWFDAVLFQLAGRDRQQVQWPVAKDLERLLGRKMNPKQTSKKPMWHPERFFSHSPHRFRARADIKRKQREDDKAKRKLGL